MDNVEMTSFFYMKPVKILKWMMTVFIFFIDFSFSRNLFAPGELTPLEQQLIQDSKDGDFDQLGLVGAYAVMTGHKNSTDHGNIQKYYRNIKQNILREIKGKAEYKKAVSLLSEAHRQLLKQYSFDSIFLREVLEKGRFNCVSSSLIYADCLDTLKIQRQFVAVTEHVFLYVYADGKKYVTEPTNPRGFDPGQHHSFVDDNGKIGWVPKVNYANPKILTDVQFMAAMAIDQRVLNMPVHRTPQGSWKISRLGLALDPNNLVLRKNVISSGLQLANTLDKSKSNQQLKDLTHQLSQLFPKEKAVIHNSATLLSKILRDELKSNPSNSVLLPYLNLPSKALAQLTVELGLARAFEHLNKQNSLGDLAILLKKALTAFPQSKHLLTLQNQIELHELYHSRNIPDVIANLEKIDSQNNKDHEGLFYTLLFPKAIKGQWAEIDEAVLLMKKNLPDHAWKNILEMLFMNLIYKEYQAKNYKKGFAYYDRSLTYTKSPKVQNNLKALTQSFFQTVFDLHGVMEISKSYDNLMKKYPGETWLKNKPAHLLSEYFIQAILQDRWDEILAAFDFFKTRLSKKAYTELVGYIFGKGIDFLIEQKNHREAEKLGELALNYTRTAHLENNYIYSLVKVVELHLMQKDYLGGFDLMLSRSRRFPQMEDWQARIQSTFFRPLVNLYLQKDDRLIRQINEKIKTFFTPQKKKELDKALGITVSYKFIQRKAYLSAVETIQDFYSQNPDPKFATNYLAALDGYLNGLANPLKDTRAREIVQKAKQHLKENKKFPLLLKKHRF